MKRKENMVLCVRKRPRAIITLVLLSTSFLVSCTFARRRTQMRGPQHFFTVYRPHAPMPVKNNDPDSFGYSELEDPGAGDLPGMGGGDGDASVKSVAHKKKMMMVSECRMSMDMKTKNNAALDNMKKDMAAAGKNGRKQMIASSLDESESKAKGKSPAAPPDYRYSKTWKYKCSEPFACLKDAAIKPCLSMPRGPKYDCIESVVKSIPPHHPMMNVPNPALPAGGFGFPPIPGLPLYFKPFFPGLTGTFKLPERANLPKLSGQTKPEQPDDVKGKEENKHNAIQDWAIEKPPPPDPEKTENEDAVEGEKGGDTSNDDSGSGDKDGKDEGEGNGDKGNPDDDKPDGGGGGGGGGGPGNKHPGGPGGGGPNGAPPSGDGGGGLDAGGECTSSEDCKPPLTCGSNLKCSDGSPRGGYYVPGELNPNLGRDGESSLDRRFHIPHPIDRNAVVEAEQPRWDHIGPADQGEGTPESEAEPAAEAPPEEEKKEPPPNPMEPFSKEDIEKGETGYPPKINEKPNRMPHPPKKPCNPADEACGWGKPVGGDQPNFDVKQGDGSLSHPNAPAYDPSGKYPNVDLVPRPRGPTPDSGISTIPILKDEANLKTVPHFKETARELAQASSYPSTMDADAGEEVQEANKISEKKMEDEPQGPKVPSQEPAQEPALRGSSRQLLALVAKPENPLMAQEVGRLADPSKHPIRSTPAAPWNLPFSNPLLQPSYKQQGSINDLWGQSGAKPEPKIDPTGNGKFGDNALGADIGGRDPQPFLMSKMFVCTGEPAEGLAKALFGGISGPDMSVECAPPTKNRPG